MTHKLIKKKPSLGEIRALAESYWEGCHGCDMIDNNFWVNGFVAGYLAGTKEDEPKTAITTLDE